MSTPTPVIAAHLGDQALYKYIIIIIIINRYRLKLEKGTIDFDTNDHYSYNDVFTLHEPKQAIKVSRDISPGIDTVHYQLLKHLPDDSSILLLYIFNHIWLTQDFPTSWKTAIIIPVPKTGKVLSEPGSYTSLLPLLAI